MKYKLALVGYEHMKMQEKLLEMLGWFHGYCSESGLSYYIVGGSMLGAIRHGGFIPWDDDIDVCMLEADYKKFCQIAPAELCEPFFFQNYKTQKGFETIC